MMFGDERWCRWQNVSQLATIFIIFDGAGQRWPALASLIYHSARTPGPSQPQYQNIWTISRAGKEPLRNLKYHNHIELQNWVANIKVIRYRQAVWLAVMGTFNQERARDLLCDCKTSIFAKIISSSNQQPAASPAPPMCRAGLVTNCCIPRQALVIEHRNHIENIIMFTSTNVVTSSQSSSSSPSSFNLQPPTLRPSTKSSVCIL